MKDILVVIPARYNSSRLPGKPLVDINGKSMINRVWEKCIIATEKENVIVATDDSRIGDHCKGLDIPYLITNKQCHTGSDRVYEVAQDNYADIYINIQGDEPMIKSNDIKKVIDFAIQNKSNVINAMCPISDERDFISPNVPKVVTREDGRLLYMSRAPIPTDKQHQFISAMKQVCIYAFPRNILLQYGSRKIKSPLESIEDLEILRILEMGHEVLMVEVSDSSIAVDTPEDLERVRKLIHD
ncbi:MAG: 3-deoxy-manno-octulosonate cytidylyltransferase [Rhodospirillaceae bacterium]|nr:3-deoxy-manno-octulosonate cytidylyltransferase [Rhodospirillaceae bacterium]